MYLTAIVNLEFLVRFVVDVVGKSVLVTAGMLELETEVDTVDTSKLLVVDS